jgi:DNA-binding NarL/FixJ family response regulator
MNIETNSSVKLLVLENQELYKFMYNSLPFGENVQLLHVFSSNKADETLYQIASHKPDVLLIGNAQLDHNMLDIITRVREVYPNLGISVLLFSYSAGDIDSIKKLILRGKGGFAVFLRQSLIEVHQFIGSLHAVKYGQCILDPLLAGHLLSDGKKCSILSQFTHREMETLQLVAEGFNNARIAEIMFIEVKTVEHHLNSMYNKLKSDINYDNKHPRVIAARIYFEEVGGLAKSS